MKENSRLKERRHVVKLKIIIAKSIIVPIFLAVVMTASSVSLCSALSYDATTVGDNPEVTVVNSVEDLSRQSEKSNNNPFFTIDATEDSTPKSLATEEIDREVEDILSGPSNTSEKQNAIIEVLEESDMYVADKEHSGQIAVTSLFAYQRLRLNARYDESLNTYGATCAVFYDDYYILSYDSEEATKNAYEALKKEYGPRAVIVDIPIKLEAKYYGWGTKHMGLNKPVSTMPIIGSAKKVRVAVLDTGILKSHPIFTGDTILPGYNFACDDSNPADDEGHGTAVAGIIAESTPFDVEILPVKVLNAKGSGGLLDILMGIDYAEKNNADIINMSLGGNLEKNDFDYINYILRDVKPLLVCASGNESCDLDKADVHEFPGELSNAVCVGAITAGDKRCSFSNYGQALDFVAPGQSIYLASHRGGFTYASGTSFACPYIAAAAARVKYENDSLNNQGIVAELRSKAVDLGIAGKDREYGYGYPNFNEEEIPEIIDITPSKTSEVEVQIDGIAAEVAYTGQAITMNPQLIVEGVSLTQGIDYDVSYKNNVNVGTAYITFKGKGRYTGTVDSAFKIVARKITPSVKLSAAAYTYSGKVRKPAVTVNYGNTILKNGTDYTLKYSSGLVNVGTYHVTVTLKGNYSGSKTVSYRINKAANTLLASGRTATVYYRKVSKKSQTIGRGSLITIKNSRGKLSYTKLSGDKRISLNKQTGQITVKKGVKKGTYKIRIRVNAAGTANYKAHSKIVTTTIRVR